MNSAPFVLNSEAGAGLCQLFTMKKIGRGPCKEPRCHWDTWKDVNVTSNKIVLSYSHNGFGNQLWEHSFAFAVAGALGSRFLVGMIPPSLYIGGYMPPNTPAAFELVNHLLPNEFEYNNLPPNAPERKICEQESFFISDRPKDLRKGSISRDSLQKMIALLSDPKPRCLKLLGYFQQSVFCDDDVRELWGMKNVAKQMSLINITDFGVLQSAGGSGIGSGSGSTPEAKPHHPNLHPNANIPKVHGHVPGPVLEDKAAAVATALNQTELLALLGGHNIQMSLHDLIALQRFPGPGDLCIYLRCLPSHYHYNAPVYFRTLLQGVAYERIVVFEAPPCARPNGRVWAVLDYLYNSLNATKFKRHVPTINVTVPEADGAPASLHTIQPKLGESLDMFLDLYGLTQGKKVWMLVVMLAWLGLCLG